MYAVVRAAENVWVYQRGNKFLLRTKLISGVWLLQRDSPQPITVKHRIFRYSEYQFKIEHLKSNASVLLNV